MKDNTGKIKNLTIENNKFKMQAKLLAQEVMKLREEVAKQSAEKDRYKEALIKIKNSFYQTNVFS